MKKIQLTQNKFTIVDDEDYEHLNQFNWHIKKGRNTYYAVRTNFKLNKKIPMHRIIMNPSDNMQIDHINGNGLDNRKENLRVCNRYQNGGNSRLSKSNISGIKGVSWNKKNKKWVAQICINSKQGNLGSFINKFEAKEAYEKAAKEYHKEFYSDGIHKEDKELVEEIKNTKNEFKERLRISNTSGIKGVSWDKNYNKWQAQICRNRKEMHLGYYSCIADAKAAYDVASKQILFGGIM